MLANFEEKQMSFYFVWVEFEPKSWYFKIVKFLIILYILLYS